LICGVNIEAISLYIHIPFCRSKCAYCDFLSFRAGRDECREYIDALISELSFYRGESIRTMYIGGGTPTLLEEAQMARLFEAIQKLFDLSKIEECTIESNPESLSARKVKLFLSGGVNRVSLGVQSFDNRVMKAMQRPTRKRHTLHSISLLRTAGIENIGLDLILGLQKEDQYKKDLDAVLKIMPAHISVYMLHIGSGTPLERMVKTGRFVPMSEYTFERLYGATVDMFSDAGYSHYEISNFARPGYECRHNINYWEAGGYIGVGLGAVSTDHAERRRNACSMREYIRHIRAGTLPVTRHEHLGERELRIEKLMLCLRMSKGITVGELYALAKKSSRGLVRTFIEQLVHLGYAERRRDRLSLSVSGIMRSDFIVTELLRAVEGEG
jgi:oxygen-independent coproporphyrinogen-3 oxidase